MKLKSLLTTLAAAVGLTTAATAATPTVVWDGDFGTKTYSGWTIDYKSNSTADGVLTIDQSVGAVFTGPNSTLNNSTYIIKCTNLDLANANNQYLLSLHQNILGGGNGDASYNKVGVSLAANNTAVRGIWNNAIYTTQGGGHQAASPLTAGTYLAINIQTSGGVFVWEITEDASGNRTLTKVYGNTDLKASNTNYKGFTLGGIYEKTSSTLNPATGWKISSLAVFNSTLSESEIKAYRFQSDMPTYTATVSTDTKWSEISWDKTVADWSIALLNLTVENGAKITMDENPTFAELNITGTMTIAADGVTGEDLAKSAVVGAPYSYWLINTTGTITGTVAMDPDIEIPALYSAAVENVNGYGVRAVITAPDKAQFGALSVNFYRANALGSGVSGFYPVDRSLWKNLTIGASASATYDEATVTLSANASSYAKGGVGDPIYQDYIDDSQYGGTTKGFTLTNITYEKYRIIVYFNSDDGTATKPFYPMVVNGVSYAGAYKDGTASCTVKGSSVTWGQNGLRGTPAEGNNALITDVMTNETATLEFLNASGRGTGRATPAAFQIVKVGEVYEEVQYAATVSEATDWNDITWTPSKPEEGFPENAALTITAEGNPTITFSEEVAQDIPLTINGAVTLTADDSLYEDGCWEKTIATFSAFTADAVTFAGIMDGYKGAYTQTETGFKLRGQNREVISINIAGGDGGGSGADSPAANLVSGSDFYGIAPTLGDSWNNINRQWQSGGNQTISIDGPNAYDGETVIKRPTMSLSATGKNTWQCGSIVNPFLRGYLDDGNGVTVTVHGVPYESYDVIVYVTSDSSLALAPVTVNGTTYTYVDGELTEGDTAWGVGMYATPEVGKNAIRINGCSGEQLTISAASRASGTTLPRGTFCAVQVICQGEIVVQSDYVADVEGDVEWTDGTDENLTPYGDAWENGSLSTLTLTNKTAATFEFMEATSGMKFTVVSEGEDKLTIPADCLGNFAFGITDFSAAFGKVEIDISGLEAAEQTLLTSEISGVTNITFTGSVEGYGAYADAKGIYLYPAADTTRQNPITGDDVDFTYFFDGAVDGDWENVGNWRKNLNGISIPFADNTLAPGLRGSIAAPMLFDGDLMGIEAEEGYKCVTADGDPNVDGWVAQYGLYNGVKVTIGHLYGVTSGGQQLNYYVDDSSKLVITTGPDTNYGVTRTLNMWVAAQEGVEFVEKTYSVASVVNYYFDGNGSVKFTKGISGATHNLTGGQLVIGGDGFTGGTLNVTNDAALAFTTNGTLGATTAIGGASKLTIDPNGWTVDVTGAITCNGAIEIADSSEGGNGTVHFTLSSKVDPAMVTVTSGNVIFDFTVDINNCGRFDLPAGLTANNVKLYDTNGNEVAFTDKGTYLEFDWNITGTACWWDYEFEGNVTSVGTDTTTMTEEGTKPFYNDETNALWVGHATHYRAATYPSALTAVLYGKMVSNEKHAELGFGSVNTSANDKFGVLIACGDPDENEVRLLITKGWSVVTTVSMTVPNAYTADHLYAFTYQVVEGKTQLAVYLDGDLFQTYSFDSAKTLSGGFQIGSMNGGIPTGYSKASTNDVNAFLDFLRVYDVVLNEAAMKKYAEEYKYESENGSATRTFDAAEATWTADDAWTIDPYEGETYTTNKPTANAMVTIDASVASAVTLDLDEAATYESLKVQGDNAITLKAGGTVEPMVVGLTSVGADVTVDYNAIRFGNISVKAGKTLTFDFSAFPFADYATDTTITITGFASGDGTITATGLPTEGVRTAVFEKNGSTGKYELTITVDKTIPFIYTIAAEEVEGTWTWNGEATTFEQASASTAPVIKEGAGALEMAIGSRTFTVNGGTLRAGASGSGTITVNTGATFDANGKFDGNFTVNLNGGAYVNNGVEMGTGKKQMSGLALTADSTVGGTGNFGLISSGYNPNTLDLGGATLTKTDANTFYLCHTTVTNGTLDVTAGAIQVTGYANTETTVASDAEIVLHKGTTLAVSATLNIGVINADSATINNTGTITPFTLTGSATLTGGGNWGTNTLANGASVTVGTKRDFVFAGAGTVNVTLTDDEIADGAPITLFTTNGVTTTAIGTITYNGADITEQCEKSGNQITSLPSFEATVGTKYYLTLAEALEAAKANETVTLLKNVTVASLTVPETVTLDPTADYTITVDPKTVVNNGTIVVYDIATATALKDLDGTLKAGADLDGKPAMFYPQGTTVAHSTEVVESVGHTNNVPTLYVTVPSETTVIWGQGVNPYQKMYVTGDAEFAGNISAGWDTNKLQTVFYAYGALKLNSDVNIGKYALATVISDALDLNGNKFILNDTDAILTTSTNLVAGVDVTTDKEGYEVKMTESGVYYYYTIEEKTPSGPVTPPTGGGSVAPAEGEAGVYIVEPDPSSKTVTIVSGLGETDVIRVTNTVDMTVVGVPASQIEIKIGGTVIPTAAFIGGDDAGFSTALNPNGVVEGVKVQPEIATSEEVPTPFVVGTDASATVKTINGLTYKLIRDTTPNGSFDTTAATATGNGEPVTLTDTEKPDGKAFYKVQVTK